MQSDIEDVIKESGKDTREFNEVARINDSVLQGPPNWPRTE